MRQLYRAKKILSTYFFFVLISQLNYIWAEKPKSVEKLRPTCTQCVTKKSNAKCTKVHFAHEPRKNKKNPL